MMMVEGGFIGSTVCRGMGCCVPVIWSRRRLAKIRVRGGGAMIRIRGGRAMIRIRGGGAVIHKRGELVTGHSVSSLMRLLSN